MMGGTDLIALGAQLGNPKTAIVYGSIFAALLPPELPLIVAIALPALMLIVEAGWYSVVALAFSSASLRAACLRVKTVVDRTAAGVLGFLALS